MQNGMKSLALRMSGRNVCIQLAGMGSEFREYVPKMVQSIPKMPQGARYCSMLPCGLKMSPTWPQAIELNGGGGVGYISKIYVSKIFK